MTSTVARARRPLLVAALLVTLALGGPFSGCHGDDEDGFYPPGPGAAQ